MLTPFGKAVRKLRIDRDISLRQMADGVFKSAAYLSSIETGKRALTDNVRDDIIQFFNLNDEDAGKLKRKADMTNDSVNIKLSSLNNSSSEVALVFARKVDTLSNEKIKELMRILNDD